MCGLLPCEFWLAVVVYPRQALVLAIGAGFLLGVGTVAFIQCGPVARLIDRAHRAVLGLPQCGPEGCYCRRTCGWAFTSRSGA